MIRASDLFGCVVRTESGEKLGRVHDLRAVFDGNDWTLLGLVVGRGGLRARLGSGDEGATRTGDVVAWEAITRLEEGEITVLDVIAESIS